MIAHHRYDDEILQPNQSMQAWRGEALGNREEIAKLRARVDDLEDHILWWRKHSIHGPCEIKTIGHMAFDPRKHCGICSMRDGAS